MRQDVDTLFDPVAAQRAVDVNARRQGESIVAPGDSEEVIHYKLMKHLPELFPELFPPQQNPALRGGLPFPFLFETEEAK